MRGHFKQVNSCYNPMRESCESSFRMMLCICVCVPLLKLITEQVLNNRTSYSRSELKFGQQGADLIKKKTL